MNIKKSLVLALSIAFSSLSVGTAAAEDLPRRVAEVFVSNDGTLTVDLAGDEFGNLHLCSVSATVRAVNAAACTQIASLLMAAKLSGNPVVIVGGKERISTSTSYLVTVNYVKFDG